MCLEDRAGGRSSDSIVVTLSARLEKHYCNDHGLPGLCSEGACRVQAEVNLLQEMEMYMPYITAEAFKHLVHRLPTLLVMDKPSMLLGSILSRDVKGPLTDVDAWRPDDPVRTYGRATVTAAYLPCSSKFPLAPLERVPILRRTTLDCCNSEQVTKSNWRWPRSSGS